MDNGNNDSTSAGKRCSGATRKFSFLDALSPEERELFEEHAKDDEDDMPSCSGAQKATSTATSADAVDTNKTSLSNSDMGRSQWAYNGGARKKRKGGSRLE